MRVLMLGWEFPPFISGGLGTACFGLTRAMSQMGIEVVFVLPRPVESEYTSHVKLASPSSVGMQLKASEVIGGGQGDDFSNVTFRTVPSVLQPYQSSESYQKKKEELQKGDAWTSSEMHHWL